MCKGNRSERLKSHGGVQQRSALDDEMASRRFIETGKPILSLCTFVRLSRMCLYYLRSASLQVLATTYRHQRLPTSCNPSPTPSSSILYQRVRHLQPNQPPNTESFTMFLAGRNPQEFHFVCQGNYMPEFYTRVRPSFTEPCKYPM